MAVERDSQSPDTGDVHHRDTEDTEKAVRSVPAGAYLRATSHESRVTGHCFRQPQMNADERRSERDNVRSTPSHGLLFSVISVSPCLRGEPSSRRPTAQLFWHRTGLFGGPTRSLAFVYALTDSGALSISLWALGPLWLKSFLLDSLFRPPAFRALHRQHGNGEALLGFACDAAAVRRDVERQRGPRLGERGPRIGVSEIGNHKSTIITLRVMV